MRSFGTSWIGLIGVLFSVLTDCKSVDYACDRIPYDVQRPDRIMTLSSELEEISGLVYYQRRDILLAVNDELGVLYGLDPEDGAIRFTWDIGRGGDYEALALDNDIVCIMESNGHVTLFDLIKQEVTGRYKNDLTRLQDIEGAYFDRGLFVVCKEKGLKKDQKIGKKPVYSVPLQKKARVKLAAQISTAEMAKLSGTRGFWPSGMAMSASDNQLYMLSARSQSLAVLRDEEVVCAIKLDPHLHRQPEAICFDGNKRLYIANEANGAEPTISVFSRQE